MRRLPKGRGLQSNQMALRGLRLMLMSSVTPRLLHPCPWLLMTRRQMLLQLQRMQMQLQMRQLQMPRLLHPCPPLHPCRQLRMPWLLRPCLQLQMPRLLHPCRQLRMPRLLRPYPRPGQRRRARRTLLFPQSRRQRIGTRSCVGGCMIVVTAAAMWMVMVMRMEEVVMVMAMAMMRCSRRCLCLE